MSEEKISIIIPTRNRSSLLKRAIESIINQTYKNIEIIVVDDNSNDDTKLVARSFENTVIKYFKNRSTKGSNYSRNLGIKNSKGKYIGFLDDDDYFSDKNKLKDQIFLFEKNSNIGFVSCGYYDEYVKKNRMPTTSGKIDKSLLLSFSFIETSTILIKKKIIDLVGLLDEKFPSEQNHDFFYRISKICDFDFINRICVIKGAPKTKITINPKKKIKGYIMFHKKHKVDIKNLEFKKFLLIKFKFISVLTLFSISGILKQPILVSRFNEFFSK